MKTNATLAAVLLTALALTTATAAPREAQVDDRPAIMPTVRADSEARGAEIGVTVDLFRVGKAFRRPTRAVYTEEAVGLWRPAYGQQIAANEAPGTVGDVNAAVRVTETNRPATVKEAIAGHFARNAGYYVAGAVLGAGAAALYIAKKQGEDDDGKAQAPEPTNRNSHNGGNNTPTASPQTTITAGDNSPVTVTVTVAPAAEAAPAILPAE